MKKLILVRHAESSTPENTEDFNRPLSNHGHAEARKMAAYLRQRGEKIDGFATSPAKRALTTCRYFAETFDSKNIRKIEDLYESSADDFRAAVATEPEDSLCLAIFSHNPGISEFASTLAQKTMAIPTCGVAIFESEAENWQNFFVSEIKLLDFFEPKEI